MNYIEGGIYLLRLIFEYDEFLILIGYDKIINKYKRAAENIYVGFNGIYFEFHSRIILEYVNNL